MLALVIKVKDSTKFRLLRYSVRRDVLSTLSIRTEFAFATVLQVLFNRTQLTAKHPVLKTQQPTPQRFASAIMVTLLPQLESQTNLSALAIRPDLN